MSGRRVLPEETLRVLLDSFRAQPGHIASAWRAAGVNYATAKKAWEQGFPGRPGWEKPMSQMVLEEQAAARAKIKELEETVQTQAAELEAKRRDAIRAKALEDVTEGRVAEGQIIRQARSGIGGLLKTLNVLTYGTVKVGAKLKDSLDTLADKKDPQGNPVPLTVAEMQGMVLVCTRLSLAMKQVIEGGQTVMEMERLLLGEPQRIEEHQHREMTLDQAAAEIEAGQRALERARRKQESTPSVAAPSGGHAQGVDFAAGTAAAPGTSGGGAVH